MRVNVNEDKAIVFSSDSIEDMAVYVSVSLTEPPPVAST